MRAKQSKKDRQQPDATAPAQPRRGPRFDWVFLLYPACVLAALAVLYVVNHTIEGELPVRPDQRAAQRELSASNHRGQSASATANGKNGSLPVQAGPVSRSENAGETVDSGMNSLPAEDGSVDSTAQAAAPADETGQDGLFDHLEGPARIVALLRMATEEKDHTRIKECLNELVALGDTAVVPLNDLVNNGGEAGLWAAEALARIGTPMAASALLDTLAQTKEGSFKEELGRRVSGITNHESWPLLLDSMVQTGDATVARAAGSSLARMADTPVLDGIIARYEAAATETEIERIAQLVRNIQSSKATDGLLSLAGDITSAAAGQSPASRDRRSGEGRRRPVRQPPPAEARSRDAGRRNEHLQRHYAGQQPRCPCPTPLRGRGQQGSIRGVRPDRRHSGPGELSQRGDGCPAGADRRPGSQREGSHRGDPDAQRHSHGPARHHRQGGFPQEIRRNAAHQAAHQVALRRRREIESCSVSSAWSAMIHAVQVVHNVHAVQRPLKPRRRSQCATKFCGGCASLCHCERSEAISPAGIEIASSLRSSQ